MSAVLCFELAPISGRCSGFIARHGGAPSGPDRQSYEIYMSFFWRQDGQVQFLEAGLKAELPRAFTFSDPRRFEICPRAV